MKSIRLLLALVLCHLNTFAQEMKRIEFPIAGSQMETFSIPIGEKGVIVLTHLGKAEYNLWGIGWRW